MTKIMRSVVFILLGVKCIFGSSPYANGYPYKSYEFSNTEGNVHQQADNTAFTKNQLEVKGNEIKSSIDSGKFYNTENISKGHNVNSAKNGASTDTHKHTIGEDFETDKSHNRKHIKSGFHNTYNKDESGSNSSYYEDSDDRGGKVVVDKKYGNKGGTYDTKFNEGQRDNAAHEKHDDRTNGYDLRGSQDKGHVRAQDHGNRHDYRDKFAKGHGQSYEAQGESHGMRYYPSGQRWPTDHETTRPDYYRPDSYNYEGYNNGHSPHLVNELSRPQIATTSYHHNNPYSSSLAPLSQGTGGVSGVISSSSSDRGQDDRGYYSSRHRITIYEDPRDTIDPRVEMERRGDLFRSGHIARGGIYQPSSSHLDVRPGAMRFRDFYDENRDDLRYRHY